MGVVCDEKLGVGVVVRYCGYRATQQTIYDVPGIVVAVCPNPNDRVVLFLNGERSVVWVENLIRSRIEDYEVQDWLLFRMKY